MVDQAVYVTDVDEVFANCSRYRAAVEANRILVESIVYTNVWVVFIKEGVCAPAKWAGVRGITVTEYLKPARSSNFHVGGAARRLRSIAGKTPANMLHGHDSCIVVVDAFCASFGAPSRAYYTCIELAREEQGAVDCCVNIDAQFAYDTALKLALLLPLSLRDKLKSQL